MNASIAIASDVGYYLGGGGVAAGMENYYVGGSAPAEPPGRWSGALAKDVGLTGQVDGDVMKQVYGEMVAPDGTKLGQGPSQTGSFRPVADQVADWQAQHPFALPEEVDEARRSIESRARSATLGLDLTTSVPKSVSILHAAVWRAELAADREGDSARSARFRAIRGSIDQVIEEANTATLDLASRLAMTRTGRHGGAGTAGRWVHTPDLVTASFYQHTNRSIQPQLHTHNVILNRARTAEGEIGALDTVDLRNQKHAFSAVFDRGVAEGMDALGFEMEMRLDGRERPYWEVKGIDRDMIELVSDRAVTIQGKFKQQLAEAEASAGRELTGTERWQLKQRLTLNTRSRKSKGESVEETLERVQNKIMDRLATGMGPIAERALVAVGSDKPGTREPRRWSPDAVTKAAVAAVSEQYSTWRRADLVMEIEQRMPILGSGMTAADHTELLERLTDRAIADRGLVVRTTGREGAAVPYELGGPGVYSRPSEVRYAATNTVAGEKALREAAAGTGRHSVKAADMAAFVDGHEFYKNAGPDQREAIVGMAASDRGIVTFEAAAGTGKSFALGGFAAGWEALSDGGRVHGLAPSERAAQVLEDDGVKLTANTAKWLAAQERIAEGRALPDDQRFRVYARDVVVVDEASMVSMAQLTKVREVVEAKGARLVLAGDPRQLAAVEAGGALGLLEGHAHRYTLQDVRRFRADWEGEASLRLRDGDVDVLAEYDRRGRIEDCESIEEAIERVAEVAFADRISDRDAMVVTGTNEQAAAVSAAIRERLVEAGLVQEAGVELEGHGGVAGVGDQVACRQNNHRLGVTNRRLYTVTEVDEDGSISVASHATGQIHRLPGWYVSKHVSSGYAGTAHAVQGMTVDAGYTVTDGSIDAKSLYVMLTRGREMNKAFVATAIKDENPSKAQTEEQFNAGDGQIKSRIHQISGDKERATGRSVLADALQKTGEERDAALVIQERDTDRIRSMSAIQGRIEDAVRITGRTRTDGWLDELATVGLLSVEDRARLGADQGVEHLSRLLRSIEQAGHDPKALLVHSVISGDALPRYVPREQAGSFTTAGGKPVRSVAQVLSARISHAYEKATGERPEASAPVAAAIPAGVSEPVERWLTRLEEAADNRRRELGTQVAEEQPSWAVRSFGVVPEDPTARLEWEHKAGVVAGFREATGWEDEHRAIGDAPGLHATERRAGWFRAWEALGRPEDTRVEAGMSDGQLRLRIEAWEREQQLAPAHVDDALKFASKGVESERVAAVLAKDDEEREAHEEVQARHEEVVDAASDGAAVRGEWHERTAAMAAAAARARAELETRGVPVGRERDLTTGAEWLAAQRASDEIEDEGREIGELDIRDEVRDQELAAGFEDRSGDIAMVELTAIERRHRAAQERLSEEPVDEELEDLRARGAAVRERIADQESQEASADLAEVDPYEVTPIEVPQPREQVAEIGELSVER